MVNPVRLDRPASHVLVTGAAGFIGSHLAEALLLSGSAVRGVDCFNDNYGRPQKLRNLRHLTDWDGFEFVPLDLAGGSLRDLIDDRELVYHLAAEPGVRSSWGGRYEQYLRNNVLATQHLLEAVRESPAIRFVYASSSSVYGDPQVRPTPESEILRPRSPYGQTKAAMEHLCELYHHSFGIDVVGLRYFTVYGPRQRPDMAFHRICSAALDQRPFVVFGDGQQTRDFSYVEDIVAATLDAAHSELNGERIINVGGGSPASLAKAIELVQELSGRRLEVRHVATEHGDVRDTSADTSLARTLLGFDPQVSLAAGLQRQLDWLVEVRPSS
jgi:nucleoside-diphosphate-sugar epimerase